jgi:hypothetical protein
MFNFQDSDDLDFEGLLRRVLDHHANAILRAFQTQLQRSPMRSSVPSSNPGEVILVREGMQRLLGLIT